MIPGFPTMISVEVLGLALVNVQRPSTRGRFLPPPSLRCSRSRAPCTFFESLGGQRAPRLAAGLPRGCRPMRSLQFRRLSQLPPSLARNRRRTKPHTALRDAELHSRRVPRFRNGGSEARAGRQRGKKG